MQISGNGRYLLDNSGEPFFFLADTSWKLLYKPTREEVIAYLDNRKAKGFNVIMPVILMEMSATERMENFLGEPPLIDMDPARPNEAFFKHVDFVVEQANARGMWSTFPRACRCTLTRRSCRHRVYKHLGLIQEAELLQRSDA